MRCRHRAGARWFQGRLQRSVRVMFPSPPKRGATSSWVAANQHTLSSLRDSTATSRWAKVVAPRRCGIICGHRWRLCWLRVSASMVFVCNPRIPDARDTSRSPGFSPGTNFSSPLKSPVFFYERGRAGMLGLHFVLGVIPARPPIGNTSPPRGARLPVALRFRGLITTSQRAPPDRYQTGARCTWHELQPMSSTEFKPAEAGRQRTLTGVVVVPSPSWCSVVPAA